MQEHFVALGYGIFGGFRASLGGLDAGQSGAGGGVAFANGDHEGRDLADQSGKLGSRDDSGREGEVRGFFSGDGFAAVGAEWARSAMRTARYRPKVSADGLRWLFAANLWPGWRPIVGDGIRISLTDEHQADDQRQRASRNSATSVGLMVGGAQRKQL